MPKHGEWTQKQNSLCTLSGASQPNCLNPPSPVKPRVLLLKTTWPPTNQTADRFSGSARTHKSLHPNKQTDKFRVPPRTSPGGTRVYPRTGGQGWRSPGSPGAGRRAQPGSGRLSPASPGLRSPGAAALPPRRVPGPPLQLCGDTAAPAPGGSPAHRGKGGAGSPGSRRPGPPLRAGGEEGRKGEAREEAITRVLFPFLLRGPRKTPLMLRKCPLLRCAELMTM